MEQKPKYDVMFFNYSPVELPQLTEKINSQKDWVDFGIDNRFPEYIQSLIAKSSRHAGIVMDKAMYIGGNGWITTNLNTQTMMFLRNASNEYDLDEILFKITYDFVIYGAFALNIIWSKDRSKIVEINYVDVSKVRVQPTDPQKPNSIESYWISDGWENTRKYPPVLYQGFSTVNRKKASQIYYIKSHVAATEWYGRPDYLSGVRWIELEWEISNFHLNNVKNGFAPSFLLNWPIGMPSDEEREMLVKRFKNEYQGSNGAGVPIITFSPDKDSSPSITSIDMNDTDGRFLLLNEAVQSGILAAHRISPILGGVEVPGELGGKNQLLEQLEIFQNKYITPKQNEIEKVFNRLARINGITDHLIIQRYSDQYRKVDTNIADIISILTSGITPEQQYNILIQNAYTHEVAASLTGFKDGNNLKVSKPAPANATPIIAPKTQV